MIENTYLYLVKQCMHQTIPVCLILGFKVYVIWGFPKPYQGCSLAVNDAQIGFSQIAGGVFLHIFIFCMVHRFTRTPISLCFTLNISIQNKIFITISNIIRNHVLLQFCNLAPYPHGLQFLLQCYNLDPYPHCPPIFIIRKRV